MILRVDRADLSKNVLRGFSAFDLFLEQYPEFSERVTFVAQLMPSRTDVPEYAEYLERIEALVAVVNHRHGTPDWMPIQLKLRDDLEEAFASYKHYDVLLVNAMFDGMNLVAKEGPLLNENAGVSILSENTGAHDELGEFALSVNPFDIQELADSIHAALTMERPERARRLAGLRAIVTARDPGDWIDEQLADIGAKARRPTRGRRLRPTRRPEHSPRCYHRPSCPSPGRPTTSCCCSTPRQPTTCARRRSQTRAPRSRRAASSCSNRAGACGRWPTRSSIAIRPSTTSSSSTAMDR
jgi:hypothetical protein